MASLKFNNIYIKDYFSVAGPMEKIGQIRKFDIIADDYYFGESTFEKAEIKMQRVVIDNLLYRNRLGIHNVDCIIGGDLTNQIAVTNYSVRNYATSFLGLYNACATFPEGLIVGANLLNNENINNIIVLTSSHNLTAEKQFRYPVEYGGPKPKTTTFTSTGAASAYLSSDKKGIKVESTTLGTAVDLGIKDVYHMGAVMAPAAAKCLYDHLNDTKREIGYYDLILTGDLGVYGKEIFKDYLLTEYNIALGNYDDTGVLIYDREKQPVYAGASGPACAPLVTYGYIFDKMYSGKLDRVLLIATGALMSPTMVNEKQTIPSIAHAVSLEVAK